MWKKKIIIRDDHDQSQRLPLALLSPLSKSSLNVLLDQDNSGSLVQQIPNVMPLNAHRGQVQGGAGVTPSRGVTHPVTVLIKESLDGNDNTSVDEDPTPNLQTQGVAKVSEAFTSIWKNDREKVAKKEEKLQAASAEKPQKNKEPKTAKPPEVKEPLSYAKLGPAILGGTFASPPGSIKVSGGPPPSSITAPASATKPENNNNIKDRKFNNNKVNRNSGGTRTGSRNERRYKGQSEIGNETQAIQFTGYQEPTAESKSDSDSGEKIEDIQKFIQETSNVQVSTPFFARATAATKKDSLKDRQVGKVSTVECATSPIVPEDSPEKYIGKKATRSSDRLKMKSRAFHQLTSRENARPMRLVIPITKKTAVQKSGKDPDKNSKRMGRPPKNEDGAMTDKKRQQLCRQDPKMYLEIVCPICGRLISSRRDSIRPIIRDCNQAHLNEKFTDDELEKLIDLLIKNAKTIAESHTVIKAHKNLPLHDKGMIRFEKRLKLLLSE